MDKLNNVIQALQDSGITLSAIQRKIGVVATDAMKFTGHKSMAAFLVYDRRSEQDMVNKYFEHPFFGGKPSSGQTPEGR